MTCPADSPPPSTPTPSFLAQEEAVVFFPAKGLSEARRGLTCTTKYSTAILTLRECCFHPCRHGRIGTGVRKHWLLIRV